VADGAPGLEIGDELAGHRIDSLLGYGGMGTVFLATHLRLGRKAALKVLLPEYARDDDFRERFIRESQWAASLEHPSIIPIYDADEERGVLYIAMRYVEGEDLRSLIERKGTLGDRTPAVIEQVASALDAAHASGLVHRDVKPANMLIGDPGMRVYLTDFGIAKQASAPGLTRAGSFVGTVDYCAPEQIEGKEVDARTDIYALGCVLFHCLAGRPPYAKETEVAVMHAHMAEPPPLPSRLDPRLPEALDEVIATAMAKQPEMRYATCTALAHALREALRRPQQQTTGAVRPEAPLAAPAAPTRPAGAPAAAQPPQRKRWLIVALTALGIVVVGGGAAAIIFALLAR
jgi:serine/threonine protein kinase